MNVALRLKARIVGSAYNAGVLGRARAKREGWKIINDT